jgi:hypothetical protein
VDSAEITIHLLFAGRCLATAAVQWPISRSPPDNGSTCHNMVTTNEVTFHLIFKWYNITILSNLWRNRNLKKTAEFLNGRMYTYHYSTYNLNTLSLSFLLLPLWSLGHPWNALFHFSFLILIQTVELLGWGMSPSQGHYLYKHTINTNIHALSGIRTHDPTVWAGEYSSCIWPSVHCDRHNFN